MKSSALILATLGMVGCGGTEAGVLLIPEGSYRMGQSIVAGKINPPTGNAVVVVKHVGDKIEFAMTGELEPGYSCQPRVWVVRLDGNGDATSVDRTQENCTASLTKAAYESLRRNYRTVQTGFVERISDGDIQIELYYDRQP